MPKCYVFNVIFHWYLLKLITFYHHVGSYCLSLNVFSYPYICSCCFCDFLFLIFKSNSLVTLHFLLLFFPSFFYFWCSINVSNCNCSNYFPFFFLFFRLNLWFYLSFVKESPSKARFQRFYSRLVYHQNGSIALGYVTINYI